MFKTITFTIATLFLTCALSAKLGTRIIGGKKVPIEAFPWQVEINVDGKHYCGGSIYSSNIVITAAHCLNKKENKKIFVGTSYSNGSGTEHNIVAFKFHEKYDIITKENDIGVLRVTPDFEFNTLIQPISLAKKSPKNDDVAFVSGWGTQTENVKIELELHAAKVRIVDRKKCSKKYSKSIGKGQICAGVNNDNKGACAGDSGGPLVSNNKLVGVVSDGKKNCTVSDYPGVYADVAYYYSWIVKTIKKLQKIKVHG